MMNLRNTGVCPTLTCTLAVMAISLSACSRPVLDWRNAEVNDGLIYSGKANDPFTGQVTHVPQRFFLREQGGLEKFANVIRTSPNWSIVAIGGDELCTVSVRQGYVDGDVRCGNDENTRMSFKKGNLDGKFVYYWYGKHVADGAFDGGLPYGTEKIYGYDTGKLVRVVQWKNGVLDGPEKGYFESTGKQSVIAEWRDDHLVGREVRYNSDGKKVLDQNRDDKGILDGPYDEWFSQNGMHSVAEYSHGVYNGRAQLWDKSGKLIMDRVYRNGNVVSDALAALAPEKTEAAVPQNTDSCVNGWTNAFRRVGGSGAVITADQLDEWKDWCAQGKQPPGA